MDWIELAAAMGLFLLSHRLPAALGLKARLVSAVGTRGYLVVFSAASVALLAWVIGAAGRAPFVPLWDQMQWHRVLANGIMPVAALLAAFGTAAPNPFAFEGRSSGFDPDHPGIAGLTRQPLLWALGLWAGVHLLANGDLAHVVLFAPFLIMALLGMPMVERRRRRSLGPAEWDRLAARTGLIPFSALLAGRWRPRLRLNPLRLALGLGGWAAFWHLHPSLIGVWPGL